MTFEEWFSEVDKIFCVRMGLGVEDWPDWGWMDAFEDGLTPEEAFDTYQEEFEQ